MRIAHLALMSLLAVSLPAFSEHDDHSDQGNPRRDAPLRGPREYRGIPHQYDQHRDYKDQDVHLDLPRVEGDAWIGHDTGRDDDNYRVSHAWANGHFRGGLGREHVWHLAGGDAGHFWFNGWNWNIAPHDAPYCDGWRWDGDDISIYADPDHAGWYLAYNLRLGTYVHVAYSGR